jgi:hypothetical protein
MYSAGFRTRIVYAWLGVLLLLTRAMVDAKEEGAIQLTLPVFFAEVWSPVVLPSKLAYEVGYPIALKVEEEAEKKSHKRFGTRLYLSAALAFSAGALALWTKNTADNAYDDYLRAASQQRQKDKFSRAEDYDRISGVAFIAMEAGLVLTTYAIFF